MPVFRVHLELPSGEKPVHDTIASTPDEAKKKAKSHFEGAIVRKVKLLREKRNE